MENNKKINPHIQSRLKLEILERITKEEVKKEKDGKKSMGVLEIINLKQNDIKKYFKKNNISTEEILNKVKKDLENEQKRGN